MTFITNVEKSETCLVLNNFPFLSFGHLHLNPKQVKLILRYNNTNIEKHIMLNMCQISTHLILTILLSSDVKISI